MTKIDELKMWLAKNMQIELEHVRSSGAVPETDGVGAYIVYAGTGETDTLAGSHTEKYDVFLYVTSSGVEENLVDRTLNELEVRFRNLFTFDIRGLGDWSHISFKEDTGRREFGVSVWNVEIYL
jgi:hypothetical protein